MWISPFPCHVRTWTSNTSKFKVEASFVVFSKGVIVLRRDDVGKQIQVPLEKLHIDDQMWVINEIGWDRVWVSANGKKVLADFKSADDNNVAGALDKNIHNRTGFSPRRASLASLISITSW